MGYLFLVVGVVVVAVGLFLFGVLFGRKNAKKVQAVIDVTHQLKK